MVRCFIAVEMPEEIKKELEKIQKQLPEFNGKLTEKENLHLTLKFLGEISEEQAEKVKERLKKIKFNKFIAKLGEINVFSPSFIKIVWIKIENCDEIQGKIDAALEGLFKKEKRFMSHLTIARVKYIKDNKKFLYDLKKIKSNPLEFGVNKFSFKKSTLTPKGPVYGDILNVKLS
jgi:2'-5' RNA ligase